MRDPMKQPIITPVEWDGDKNIWELCEPFAEVPKGFRTDGATIPRFLWRVIGSPIEAQTIGAAIRHDWHYQDGDLSRKEADAEFYADLRAAGVGILRANLFWLGVRLFGWLRFNYKPTFDDGDGDE
jgi:hypothetical protein